MASQSIKQIFGTEAEFFYDPTTRVLEVGNAYTKQTVAISAGAASTFTSITATGTATVDKLAIASPSAIAIEISGALVGHGVYIHPTSMASGKRAFRIADSGTEIPIEAGEGMIRTYAKVTSGTDTTALQFHWGHVTTTAPLIGSQMEIESAATTPGPNYLIVQDLIGSIQAGKYMATGGDGFVGIRSKLYADVTSVCNSDVYPLWLDHQMSCAVAGTEASIKGTTGGSVPDCFIWLNTTSNGWSQFLYLDSTMATKQPFVSTGCSVTVASVPYLKVLVNATQYGIPLIAI